MPLRTVRLLTLTVALVAGLLVSPPVAQSGAPVATGAKHHRLRIEVLSNRADLISGGDALVAVRIPRGVKGKVRVTVGKRDVTHRFSFRRDGRYMGLVRRLALGRNVLRAKAPGVKPARIVIVNHPQGGPVFSGPQTKHYRCQDTARDKKCNEPARYDLLYRSTDPLATELKPYDPAHPPTDVATTRTDQRVTVPFIVRRERGYQDRDRYTILTLFRPGRPWKAWKPQRQWNHKLLVTHGGGCGASYSPGAPPLDDYSGTFEGVPAVTPSYITALGRGFAVISTALDNTGHNCNVALNAESVMMAKERLVERYGTLRYTIGTGCSGGSIAQHTVANAYPGIYQGLITTCSYPDTFTAGAQFADYHLLRLYFEDPTRWGPGVAWLPTQMAQVEGHLTHVNAVVADEGLFKAALDPAHDCGGTLDPKPGDPTTRYDAATNPGGVRCSVLDLLVNPLGRRPRSVWGAAGEGGRLRVRWHPVLQHGRALRARRAQDRWHHALPVRRPQRQDRRARRRLEADRGADRRRPRLDRERLPHGPDQRGQQPRRRRHDQPRWPGPGDRARLRPRLLDRGAAARRPGAHRQPRHVVRPDAADRRPRLGQRGPGQDGRLAGTRRARPVRQAAGPQGRRRPARRRHRPLRDRRARSGLHDSPSSRCCRPVSPRHGRWRVGRWPNDNVACRFQPLEKVDLGLLAIVLTDAERATLRSVFPHGVCDWSKPGVGQGPAQTWLRYDARGGGVAYGGRNLRRVPRRSATGVMSPSFIAMLRR